MNNDLLDHFTAFYAIKSSQKLLAERTFFCFKVLDGLDKAGIQYTLRGGLCLPVLLSRLPRLSQDIDIVLHSDVETLERHLNDMVSKEMINDWWPDDTRIFPHRHHYVIDYLSCNDSRSATLNLDLINSVVGYTLRPHPFRLTGSTEVFTIYIQTAEELLADKLMACALNTVGLKLENTYKRNSLVKQNFDISLLLSQAVDIKAVLDSFCRKTETENLLNDVRYIPDQILADIGHYCASFYVNGVLSQSLIDEYQLAAGITNLNKELCGSVYTLEDFILTNEKMVPLIENMIRMRAETCES